MPNVNGMPGIAQRGLFAALGFELVVILRPLTQHKPQLTPAFPPAARQLAP